MTDPLLRDALRSARLFAPGGSSGCATSASWSCSRSSTASCPRA